MRIEDFHHIDVGLKDKFASQAASLVLNELEHVMLALGAERAVASAIGLMLAVVARLFPWVRAPDSAGPGRTAPPRFQGFPNSGKRQRRAKLNQSMRMGP